MLSGFEVFPAAGRRRSGLALTVTRAGQINLSAGAYAALGSPSHVHLLYSAQRRAMAIQPAAARERNARKVFRLEGGGATIHARVFTRYCGLEDQCAHRFEALGVEDGALIAKLTEDQAAATGRQRARGGGSGGD